ncbi:hypothetical protein NE237_018131 [Protea cynaroides]|uniref:Uncharacterized protein n=1 Tax=Protea cynaroides TaxID=273540 RepID=A0A9Q0QNP9_9MAGN|nr:hypothetical protein NE237_018131 [Protea cynaroides]
MRVSDRSLISEVRFSRNDSEARPESIRCAMKEFLVEKLAAEVEAGKQNKQPSNAPYLAPDGEGVGDISSVSDQSMILHVRMLVERGSSDEQRGVFEDCHSGDVLVLVAMLRPLEVTSGILRSVIGFNPEIHNTEAMMQVYDRSEKISEISIYGNGIQSFVSKEDHGRFYDAVPVEIGRPQGKARSLMMRVTPGRGRIGSVGSHDPSSHVTMGGLSSSLVAQDPGKASVKSSKHGVPSMSAKEFAEVQTLLYGVDVDAWVTFGEPAPVSVVMNMKQEITFQPADLVAEAGVSSGLRGFQFVSMTVWTGVFTMGLGAHGGQVALGYSALPGVNSRRWLQQGDFVGRVEGILLGDVLSSHVPFDTVKLVTILGA